MAINTILKTIANDYKIYTSSSTRSIWHSSEHMSRTRGPRADERRQLFTPLYPLRTKPRQYQRLQLSVMYNCYRGLISKLINIHTYIYSKVCEVVYTFGGG